MYEINIYKAVTMEGQNPYASCSLAEKHWAVAVIFMFVLALPCEKSIATYPIMGKKTPNFLFHNAINNNSLHVYL